MKQGQHRDVTRRVEVEPDKGPDFAFWRNGVKEPTWGDVALAALALRSGGEIIALSAIVALGFLGVALVWNDGDLDNRELVAYLFTAGMIFVACLSGIFIVARSHHAANAEQVKRGAAQSGDRERCSRENGGAKG